MKAFVKGLIACLIILAMIFIFLSPQSSRYISSIKQAPDWIEGTLLMTTRGATEHTEKEPIDKYVCAFDFDNDTISAVEIPSNAELIKDMYTSKAVFFFNAEGSHQSIESVNGYTANRWWRYRRGDITYTSVGDSPALDSTLSEFVYETGERPVAILSSGGGWKDFYLLKYGISETGKPEVQLCLVKDYGYDEESLNIIHSFPDDHNFQNWNYTISEDSKIAWIDYVDSDYYGFISKNYGIGISDAISKKFLFNTDPDDGIYGGIAWLDDNTLLYISDTGLKKHGSAMLFEFTLMQWHLDTDITEPLTGPDGCNFVTDGRPEVIAVNDGATCIALYCEVEDEKDYIMFVSPKTGETYKYTPWNKDDENITHRWYEIRTHRWYGKSDEGIVFYEPYDMLEPEMIWYTTNGADD